MTVTVIWIQYKYVSYAVAVEWNKTTLLDFYIYLCRVNVNCLHTYKHTFSCECNVLDISNLGLYDNIELELYPIIENNATFHDRICGPSDSLSHRFIVLAPATVQNKWYQCECLLNIRILWVGKRYNWQDFKQTNASKGKRVITKAKIKKIFISF